MSVYAASKWAMIGWSDSVRLELAKAGHTQVKVTMFAPSYISIGMFACASGPLWTPLMTPETAVVAAWLAMLKGKPLLMKSWTVPPSGGQCAALCCRREQLRSAGFAGRCQLPAYFLSTLGECPEASMSELGSKSPN